MIQEWRKQIEETAVLNLGQVLEGEELDYFRTMFDTDRSDYRYFWHDYGHHQFVNYDALVTTPRFDELIRHPRILPAIEELMGGPVCFGEIGLRYMGPYDGQLHRGWHRDKPHWPEHPLRMDYIQLMVYLTDVDESTHCISFSPESIDQPLLMDQQAQLARGGIYDLHGPAGTCALFNVAALHTATTRPTSFRTQDSPNLLRSPRPGAPLKRFRHSCRPLARQPGPGNTRLLRRPQPAYKDLHGRVWPGN